MTAPRPTSTSADPPRGCEPAWERPGARLAGLSSLGRRHAGFTLIELLVVLAVVGLMLSIAVPRTIDHIERARETTLRSSLKEMRHALDQFEADKGRAAVNLDELVAQRYLRELPIDPITDRRDTWVTLSPAEARPADAPPASSADAPAEGVADVRSGAEGLGRDGSAYASW
jgi:general secretion pathway protein G